MNITVKIDNSGGADDGKFVCTVADEEGLGGGPFTAYIGLTDQFGGVIADILDAVAPTFAGGGSVVAKYPIPKDADGKYIAGLYTIEFRVLNAALATVGSREATFSWTPAVYQNTGTSTNNLATGSELTLDVGVDCKAKLITLEAVANNVGWTVTSKVYSVTPPPTVNVLSPIAVTSVLDPYSYGFANDGQYFTGATLERNKSTLVAGGGSDQITVTQFEKLINFSYVLASCALYCAGLSIIECDYGEIQAEQCGTDHWSSLSKAKSNALLKKLTLATLSLMAKECGDLDKERTYLNALAAETCGCGCTNCG